MVMDMKALVSSIEPRQKGYRIAQVEQDASIFSVADGLFWVDCEANVVADEFWYDPEDESIKPMQTLEIQAQPKVDGAETL